VGLATEDAESHLSQEKTFGDGSRVQFFWDPYMNISAWMPAFRDRKPMAIVMATSGLWTIKNFDTDANALRYFDEQLQRTMNELESVYPTPVFFLPISPVVHERLSVGRKMITPDKVDRFNARLHETIDSTLASEYNWHIPQVRAFTSCTAVAHAVRLGMI
jgi:hypothetical protein